MAEHRKRIFWPDAEIKCMLTLFLEKNVVSMLEVQRFRNEDIYGSVSKEMKRHGFIKTTSQLRMKWKSLRRAYYKAKRDKHISRESVQTRSYWNLLDALLSNKPVEYEMSGEDDSLFKMNLLSDETASNKDLEADVTYINCEELTYDEAADKATDEITAFDVEVLDDDDAEDIKLNISQDDNSLQLLNTKDPENIQDPQNVGTISSSEWRSIQLDLQDTFLKKCTKILQNSSQSQRNWEEKLLEKERLQDEKMLETFMSNFFVNMKHLIKPGPSNNSLPSQSSENHTPNTNVNAQTCSKCNSHIQKAPQPSPNINIIRKIVTRQKKTDSDVGAYQMIHSYAASHEN